MGEKLNIGPLNRGLRNDLTAFNIDNESFPTLINAYQWRGRVKRKRGTSLLGRLIRFLGTTDGSGNLTVTISPHPIGSGLIKVFVGTTIFTDQGIGGPAIFLLTNSTATAQLNRTTGVLQISNAAVNTSVLYNPGLPVMGLEDLILDSTQFPGTIAFDTKYSYNISTAFPYPINDVSFYKNPAADATNLPGYVPKGTWIPTSWNGQDYQQFWTTNYQGAFWATNGINVPFNINNIGMQFKPIVTTTVTAGGPPAIVTLQITGHGLVVGDFVFVNEVLTTTGINFQTGYVIAVIDANNVSVEFPFATIATNGTGGIAQYLTNRSDVTKDCIRFYDGDPTDGNPTSPTFIQGHGWVNFMPPLSQSNFSIGDLPARQYYLVGARLIVPFKDRLLFLGPVVQSSGSGPFYLQDTIVYSQNGTPYYTASYTNSPSATVDTPTSSSIVFHPILIPINQTATSPAYFEDSTGFGGFITAGVNQPIITSSSNEDVLIIGFGNTLQTRLVYSGNDIVPFNFYIINAELPSGSTFSVVNMDQGVITRGQRGYIITSQTQAQRIDLEIPDEVFEINLTTNGNERFSAQRDFINEWVYFSYPANDSSFRFNDTTLQYNYRDLSWAILKESYTHYGQFRRQTGFTWNTVGNVYPSWSVWNEPWNAGDSTLEQPDVIAGNQQGFILFRDVGTGEGTSLVIQSILNNTITSIDHNLAENDYIVITSAQGSVGTQINGKVFSIFNVTQNTFDLKPPITTATYLGGGFITRIYVPFIQTKQFPVAWQMARKTRLGPQQYLFTTTENSQITLLIFLSQNSSSPYNTGGVIPDPSVDNDSLIYNTVLFTCPESTNLGLTPANINLQIPTAVQQNQTWHRMNTSLIGDTVQIGFTLSDSQIRDLNTTGASFAITAATKTAQCVLTCTAQFETGTLILINGVVGMTELNGNIYQVVTSDATTVTINVDSSGFSTYISGGTTIQEAGINAFAEIELHHIILDVQPSQILV